MDKIASTLSVVESVVAEIETVTTNKEQKVFLSESTIASVKNGANVNNQLLSNLTKLVDCVKS